MKILKWILIIFSCAVVIVFTVSNRYIVDISLFPVPLDVKLPLSLVVLISVIIGFFITIVFSTFFTLKLKKDIFFLNRRVKALENEIASYKVDSKVKKIISDIK